MTTYASTRGVALERAYKHWRERGALLELPSTQPTAPPLTIAISRETGAGGTSIAEEIAAELGWPLYDRELVAQIAEDTGVHTELLEKLDEKKPNWLTDCLEGFSDHKNISGAAFAIRLRKILFALYCHGNCVIVGRGAAQILPPKHTLRVRFVAPKNARIARMSELLDPGVDVEQAVLQSDKDRESFVKSYFFKDPNSHTGYDLTLDTSRFSHAGCAEIILSAIKAHHENAKVSS